MTLSATAAQVVAADRLNRLLRGRYVGIKSSSQDCLSDRRWLSCDLTGYSSPGREPATKKHNRGY